MNDLQFDNNLLLALISVFLLSFLGLLFQVTLTRIFSTIIWYHYAFVAISVALFGWGLGGLVLHFFKRKIVGNEQNLIMILLLLLAVFMPFYLLVISRIPAYPSLITLHFLISLFPFFIAGTCLAFLYSKFAGSASKLYFADLIGASLACLAAEPILSAFGAESTVLFLGALASLSSLFMLLASKRRIAVVSLLGLVLLLVIFVGNLHGSFLNVSYAPTKHMFEVIENNSDLSIVKTRWNSFSRIDVVEGFQGNILAGIYIDADASTKVLRWDGQNESLQRLNQSIDVLPYYLVEHPNTLIMGPGGGEDVLFALAGGSSKIVGVELNPIIVEVVQEYGENVGNIYGNLSSVSIFVDEGRSFIRRCDENFDVITLSFVDTWAAISAGGYALAENYLYTIEAFMDYFSHLTNEGLLLMVRWDYEIPRLVSTFVEASTALGEDVASVGDRVAILLHELEPGKVRAIFIFKKVPFSVREAEKLQDQIAMLGSSFSAYYLPYVKNEVEPYRSLFNGSTTIDQYYASFSNRVDAVNDDSPYYFNSELGIPKTLRDLILLATLLSFSFVVIPLAVGYWKQRWISGQDGARPNFMLFFVLFFSSLGIGYLLLEIALIQKFILFLGYPTRALSVILFSLLLSSGIGSFISGQIAHNYQDLVKNIFVACPLIITIVIVYIISLPALFGVLLSQSSMIRMIVTFSLLFPLGFLMGIPFPSGLRILSMKSNQNVSWMWAINGATSVLGSIFATLLGIVVGFNYAMMFGATVYLIAMLCAFCWYRSA